MSDGPIKALGFGWNLGNQMDAWSNEVADETCWGNPKATQALFTKLHESGISSVRIPVTWLGHIGEAPSYTIDATWLDRVAELVGYAKEAHLKAIINIHHDGADSAHWLDIKTAAKDETVNAAIEAELAAIWTQIAEKFKNEGDYLVFESMNEIHDGGWAGGITAAMEASNMRCSTNGNKCLWMPCAAWAARTPIASWVSRAIARMPT